jgi:acetoin utilization deacetylase AcuC-like enzyme
MKFGLYFYPETTQTVKDRKEIETIGAFSDFEYRNKVISEEYASNIPLKKVSIEEFKTVHDDEYVDNIIKKSKDEEAQLTISAECSGLYYFLPGYEYSLGGVYSAVDEMKKGGLDRAYCFSLPSHHSYPNKGHGYCLLNTLAAGVRYAQSQGFKNILIIDWDHHHGDGTQTIFENDESVYQISIHSVIDLYMGVMRAHTLGTTTYGEKVGHCNIPILDVNYDDEFYKECEMGGEYYRPDTYYSVWKEKINNLPFSPDMIFIFDGHDAHKDDVGGDVAQWDYSDFIKLTEDVIKLSEEHDCPILSMPGGGYKNSVSLQCMRNHIETLSKQEI